MAKAQQERPNHGESNGVVVVVVLFCEVGTAVRMATGFLPRDFENLIIPWYKPRGHIHTADPTS